MSSIQQKKDRWDRITGSRDKFFQIRIGSGRVRIFGWSDPDPIWKFRTLAANIIYIITVVPLYSHPLYKHTLYIFTLVLGPVFYIVKCPLYCHKLIIVTITVIHGPNIIITYENFPIYSHISLLRKYIMSFESKILSFAVVSRSAPILIWK